MRLHHIIKQIGASVTIITNTTLCILSNLWKNYAVRGSDPDGWYL